MMTITKTFIERNADLLDHNLAEFIELASVHSSDINFIRDLLWTLEDAGVPNIKAAQIQALANTLEIELTHLFGKVTSPASYVMIDWIDAHNRFNLGLSSKEIMDYLIAQKDAYSDIVDIYQDKDDGEWHIGEAW